jgi:dihydrofolate synthase/folylpolyglutamate synthase
LAPLRSTDNETVLERLYRLAPRGALLGLERVRAASAAFDHPEKRFPSLHVAGTNGKGSVSAMVATMAHASGYRTGLYTSPHLCRFNERIQLGGEPVPDDVMFPVLEDVMQRCPELTFFETATLAAFVVFARLKVDLAIVEVGLGGRLDATNVLDSPRATAITTIGLDHTDRLGADIASIAREKAGILKPGVPAVLGRLLPVAFAEISARAQEVGAPILETVGDPALDAFVELHPPALLGAHQVDNARVAVALAHVLGLGERDIAVGLRDVRWPGRSETVRTPEGDVLLDAAHNPDGAQAVAAALAAQRLSPASVALVFGSMADKDSASMLAALGPHAAHRIYVPPEGRKAADPAALASLMPGQIAHDAAQALALGRKAVGPSGLVVVTGSIFLVGAARALLFGLERDPAVAL